MGPSPVIKLADALDGVDRLGFDTPPLIYFVEQNPTYIALVREVFRQVDQGIVIGYTGMISLAEVLVKPKRNADTVLEQAYRSILTGSRNFVTLPITAEIAERAADLRSRYKIKLPDALQVAAALEAGCDAILTNDGTDLRPVTEIRVLVLDDLEL